MMETAAIMTQAVCDKGEGFQQSSLEHRSSHRHAAGSDGRVGTHGWVGSDGWVGNDGWAGSPGMAMMHVCGAGGDTRVSISAAQHRLKGRGAGMMQKGGKGI
jgi:hypothetical protein